MPIRCTAAEVRNIFDVTDSTITDPIIDAFIETASYLIDDCLTATPEGDLKTKIECYLSAHFLSHRDQRSVSEKAADTAQTFQNAVDLGFNASFYGQTAMRLDKSGVLAELDQTTKKAPSIKAGMSLLNPAGTGDGEKGSCSNC